MPLVLAQNCSTQSFSGLVCDEQGREVFRHSVNFGDELGERYGMRHGFFDTGTGVVHTAPLMLIHAMELFYEALVDELGGSVKEIVRVTGAAQQHGTVYWSNCGLYRLANLVSNRPMHEQFGDAFSRPTVPIWRDSSTEDECLFLAEQFGSSRKVAERVGAPPTERFALPQILKFAREEQPRYEATALISLISSFCCSLLIGEFAPIDYGDASGMNLMNLGERSWDVDLLLITEPCAPKLTAKLRGPTPSSNIVGTMSPYFIERYGFSPECLVLAFSGDNNDSLLGTGVYAPGQARMLTFGTSDCQAGVTDALYDPACRGYVFACSSGRTENFGISVHANGALMRMHYRDRFGLDWNGFSEALANTQPAGSGGLIAYTANEITPKVQAPLEHPYGGLAMDSRDDVIRALVEFQFMTLRHHGEWLGDLPAEIHATGGASVSQEFLQVGADIFDVPFVVFEHPDSVSLGGVLRCLKSLSPEASWDDLTSLCVKPSSNPVMPSQPEAYQELRSHFPERLTEATISR